MGWILRHQLLPIIKCKLFLSEARVLSTAKLCGKIVVVLQHWEAISAGCSFWFATDHKIQMLFAHFSLSSVMMIFEQFGLNKQPICNNKARYPVIGGEELREGKSQKEKFKSWLPRKKLCFTNGRKGYRTTSFSYHSLSYFFGNEKKHFDRVTWFLSIRVTWLFQHRLTTWFVSNEYLVKQFFNLINNKCLGTF